MPEADSNRMALLYVPESVFGVTPATPAMKRQRFTSEDLGQDTEVISSQEIRDDRQVPDYIRVDLNGAGSVNGEFSASTYDEWLQWALLSAAWSSPVVVGPITTISASSVDNSFNDSANGFGPLVVGQWVKTTQFTNVANNGWFKILTKTAAKITVSGGTLVTEAAGANRTIDMGAQILGPGVTPQSLTLEKQFKDLSSENAVMTGMMIDQFTMGIVKKAIMSCGWTFVGVKEESFTDTRAVALGGTETPAPSEDVMNCVKDVRGILEGQLRFDVTSLNWTGVNNLRARTVVGTEGAISVGTGSLGLTGNMEAYYRDKTVFNKYLAYDATSLAFILSKATKSYVFDMPRIKLATGRRNAGGINTDLTQALSFNAMRDPTDGITLRIARW